MADKVVRHAGPDRLIHWLIALSVLVLLATGFLPILGVDFDWVVTAQQVGTYKPDERNFQALLDRVGLPKARIVHVAQSLFHDHVPAKRLGFTSVWIDRRHDRPGSGATPSADARPDATYPDMASFAEAAVPH